MATVHLYLDKRSAKEGEEAPLKISINKQSSSAYISLHMKILPSQWDSAKERITNHPNRAMIQNFIDAQKSKVATIIMDLTQKGELSALTATQIKNKVLGIIDPEASTADSFFRRYMSYSETRQAKRTKEIYLVTAKRMQEYDAKVRTKTFAEINKDWLNGFDAFLIKTTPSVNGRSIHFRNIRAVFNDALDNGITTSYPFRVFKIRNEETQKRSLTVEQLRELFNADVSGGERKALDLFKLCFFLIGINVADLSKLQTIGADGRIEYRRQKTKKLYSVKVEPEALEIINRYKGKTHLLDILDTYKNVHTFTVFFDKNLKRIGGFKGLTSYWARHTWATIASDIDIPEDVISRALGHSFSTGAAVTQVYINFNKNKIDTANRLVMDYVLSKGRYSNKESV